MFWTLKCTYLENHWYLSSKWSHLIKNLSLVRTFIHGYCEVFNKAWHSQQIHRGFLGHCFCYCGGYIFWFWKINWHFLSGFFPLVFGISLALWLKLMQKMSYWIVFSSRTGLPFFFDFCHICLLSASWVLFFKKKPVHCILWVYA